VKLAFSSDDRLLPARGQKDPSVWVAPLLYGLFLPFTLVALGFGGWYVATGETPAGLAVRLLQGPRISMPMPPRLGAETVADALLRPAPPAEKTPPATGPAALPPSTPTPTASPSPANQTPAAEPPKVSLPAVPVTAPAMEKAPEKVPTASAAPAVPAAPEKVPAAPTAPAVPARTAPTSPASTYVPPPPPPPLAEPAIPPGGESLAPPSFAQLASLKEPGKPLTPGPAPDLLRQTGNGALPVRAGNREAWKVYARPITVAQSKPGAKIAIVVTGLGLSKDATTTAISKLPPDISLSFSPYGSTLDGWIKRARENGHEALLDLPLEPPNFPQHDPGAMAVLQSHSPGEALGHLDALLGKATSYVGVAASLHSPVTATDGWSLMLQDLRDRGLLLVGDGLVGIEDKVMPAAGTVTLVADETPFRVAVDAKLARALLTAQRDGSAIVTLSPRPVSFERLLAFIASLPEKNVTLVPVSALVRAEP
jgi:polysaccharide deacetylase 2 family uncharacterized protein YibQ